MPVIAGTATAPSPISNFINIPSSPVLASAAATTAN
jgi:hypothetical protein